VTLITSKAQPHVAINNGSTSWILAFNYHHHLSRPLPRLSQAQKASKNVSNWFHNLLHALLTINHPTGILRHRRSFDDLPTPPHPADQFWGGSRLSRGLQATKTSRRVSPPLSWGCESGATIRTSRAGGFSFRASPASAVPSPTAANRQPHKSSAGTSRR